MKIVPTDYVNIVSVNYLDGSGETFTMMLEAGATENEPVWSTEGKWEKWAIDLCKIADEKYNYFEDKEIDNIVVTMVDYDRKEGEHTLHQVFVTTYNNEFIADADKVTYI